MNLIKYLLVKVIIVICWLIVLGRGGGGSLSVKSLRTRESICSGVSYAVGSWSSRLRLTINNFNVVIIILIILIIIIILIIMILIIIIIIIIILIIIIMINK